MNLFLSTLLDILTSFLKVLEEEGRLLRRSVMRLGWAFGFVIIATLLLLAAAGFLLLGLYQALASHLSPAGASLIIALLAFALAVLFAILAKCKTRDPKDVR